MKILVIRTDRIGEVLLSTPILTALKEKWPEARISMMIRPEVKELVEDSPYVDDIIESNGDRHRADGKLFDGVSPHYLKGREGVIRAAFRLRKILKDKGFDITIVVNPKKEFHLATFLAGIPVRVGFDRKWGFLLTHKVKDLKFLAEKHEVEYNLDLVRALGIEPKDKRPVLIIKGGDRHLHIYGDRHLAGGKPVDGVSPHFNSISPHLNRMIAIHPCTSNPKKQWSAANFAKLGDLLAEKGYNIVMISGLEEQCFARGVISMMQKKHVVDLAGKLTLKELPALLKRCKFLVSGDSGPVHIAAAVGTPVVVLFGREDPGSRPKRWGPYGQGHIVIEKDKLEDITPEEVLKVIKV